MSVTAHRRYPWRDRQLPAALAAYDRGLALDPARRGARRRAFGARGWRVVLSDGRSEVTWTCWRLFISPRQWTHLRLFSFFFGSPFILVVGQKVYTLFGLATGQVSFWEMDNVSSFARGIGRLRQLVGLGAYEAGLVRLPSIVLIGGFDWLVLNGKMAGYRFESRAVLVAKSSNPA